MATVLFAIVLLIALASLRLAGGAAREVARPRRAAALAGSVVSALFLYPMSGCCSGAFRSTREILSATAAALAGARRLDAASAAIADAGGSTLVRAALNSVRITGLSTLLAVAVTAFGAYA